MDGFSIASALLVLDRVSAVPRFSTGKYSIIFELYSPVKYSSLSLLEDFLFFCDFRFPEVDKTEQKSLKLDTRNCNESIRNILVLMSVVTDYRHQYIFLQ